MASFACPNDRGPGQFRIGKICFGTVPRGLNVCKLARGRERDQRARPGRGTGGECNLEKLSSLVVGEHQTLFALHRFVDHNLPAFVHVHYSMDGFVSGESNVNDVIALIEHEFHGRSLIQHAPVHAYLGSFWLSLDVDRAHIGRAVSTALEKLLEFANRLDVVYVAKRPQRGSEMECLTGLKICGGGFVQVTLLPDQEGMRSLVHDDLGGSGSSAILAVNEN